MELTWRNVAIIDLIICTNWRYWKIAEKTRRKSNRVKYKTVMLHWKGLYLLWLSIGRIDEPFQSCKIVTITGNISSLQIPLFFYIYDMQIRLLVLRKSSPDRVLPLFLHFLVRWRETINWFQKMHHILPANPPRGLNAHRYTMINLDLRKQLNYFESSCCLVPFLCIRKWVRTRHWQSQFYDHVSSIHWLRPWPH